ncbi:helix-turn-helix domain-containing protein [Mycolicibacterium sp. jd]|uniref:helix-turn-helix domain-containing protein n=1 Tax=unclassified Mycolicibacterium TaxID=2636767 RepID=UPI00298C632E|nr:helix-turn-helix transcriptional regulator [Mycolicibacterium sp. D5.8-2]MDW5610548.1 helix-turn-helix transcriptional regulator [Mycolicibacterium sp. D5.8-2]
MSDTGKLDYQWNLRELMAQQGMYQTTQLRPKLQERGIELSDSQVYRLVVDTPERINIKMLVALMDILGCGMEELIRPMKLGQSSARAAGERQGPEPGVGSHRPKRARITTNER